MAIVTTQLELFRILKQKLGEQESEILVKFIQENTEDEMLKAKHDLVTRKDLEHAENKFIWIFGIATTFMFALSIFFYNNLDKRMDKLDTRMDKLDARIDRLEQKMDTQYRELNDKIDRQFEQLVMMIQNLSNKK